MRSPDAIDPHLLDVVREGAYWTTAPRREPLQNLTLAVTFKVKVAKPKPDRRPALDEAIRLLARRARSR